MKIARIIILLLVYIGFYSLYIVGQEQIDKQSIDYLKNQITTERNQLSTAPEARDTYQNGVKAELMEVQIVQDGVNNKREILISDSSNSKTLIFEEFIKLVSNNNKNILAKKHGFEASQANLAKEQDVFEPQIVMSYQEGESHIRYSQSEAFSLFRSEKDEETKQYQTRIESNIPSGASVSFGYTLTATKDKIADTNQEYTSYLGIQIVQPILKNSGMTVRSEIMIAEKGVDVAFQSYRQEMMQIIYEAVNSSFDLYEAWAKYHIQKSSVEIAERILKDNKIRYRLGRMAQTEVFEAEAGLLERRSLEIKARQDLDIAMSNIRTFIADTNASRSIYIDVRKLLEREQSNLNFTESFKKALLLRPDYLLAKLKVEQEDIRILYAKNQRWPQLDLKGSYGLNGLGDSSGKAWDSALSDDYRSWTVGLEFSFPLYGGLYSKNDLLQVNLQKKQALIELKAVEVKLSNLIHSAIQDVQNTRKQGEFYKQAEALNQKLLDIELKKYKAGQSNSRLLLEREKQLNLIKESNLAIQMYHQKAISKLEFAEGLILGKHGMEITQEIKK